MVPVLKLSGWRKPWRGRRSRPVPREAGRFTMENLFKFLHILAVIVWVGGVLTVNVLQVLTEVKPR